MLAMQLSPMSRYREEAHTVYEVFVGRIDDVVVFK